MLYSEAKGEIDPHLVRNVLGMTKEEALADPPAAAPAPTVPTSTSKAEEKQGMVALKYRDN